MSAAMQSNVHQPADPDNDNQIIDIGPAAQENQAAYQDSPRRTNDASSDIYAELAEAVDAAEPQQHLANLRISPIMLVSGPEDNTMQLYPKVKEGASGTGSPSQVTPPQDTFGAGAPFQENVGAVALKQETVNLEKFFYASVVARQEAAAAAAAAEEAALAAPLPPSPIGRKRLAERLTIKIHHVLPERTPFDHTHRLIDSHPWAKYVKLRNKPLPTSADVVTSELPLDVYDHIPTRGYLSPRYVRRLFPHTFREKPSRSRRLPILELMQLEHAVSFRKSSQTVIFELLQNQYVTTENILPETREGTMPSVILPPCRPQFPVLYQVVNRGHGQGVIIEAKDFFIPGPDRRELHLIVLDQYATNIGSNTRGFDRSLLSVKDFVWVYSVEPTRAALRDPQTVLDRARIPKATALDNRFPYFFRVKEFVFVTPPATSSRTLGIVMSLLVRYDAVKGLKVAFESAPEAVAVSPSICDFPLAEAEQDEIVAAHARRNVSCSIRFSEQPVSKEAQMMLCSLVRGFLPAHPEEGMLPLRVFKLNQRERDWIADRAGDFTSYHRNPWRAQKKMTQLFNVACSALAAVNYMNDDRTTHMLTATIPSLQAYPARFDFTIDNMSSECGWTNQRPVYLWIVGAQSLIRATIQHAEHSYENRSMAIRLVIPFWAHRSTMKTLAQFAVTRNDVTTVEICVRLGAPPSGAEPLYQLISERQLFGENLAEARARDVLDTVYGGLRAPVGPVGPQRENAIVSVGGRSFPLKPDQLNALRMGDLGLPVLAIQAAFGTGKTVVGALLAARIYSLKKEMVIATTTTNTAVAQFTDTLLKLDQYKHLDILRYVSDSALSEGSPQTEIDLHHILKRLPVDYGHLLSAEAYSTCLAYKRGRELLERFMFENDLSVNLTDAERDEYRIAERDISDLTKSAVSIMFEVRPPAVICLTTSALLNSISADGIFSGKLNDVTTLIGDEASQIPEPALVAMASHLPRANHVYIGDIHQLEPHARCPRTSNPARFGAQGVMDVLLSKGVPTAPLTTTFRAHPRLNELPNLAFYNQSLVSGTAAEDRQMFLNVVRCPNPDLPFLFVDVPGSSIKALSGSHINESEAELCRQVVMSLLAKNISPSSIAIVVFYKEQARLLESFASTADIDMYTVDSVQGREMDIVVLLTTRTGFDASRGEFLNDPRRLNVALSRCRHGQFVLGHEKSLLCLSYWHTILQWARNRNAYTTASSLPDLFE